MQQTPTPDPAGTTWAGAKPAGAYPTLADIPNERIPPPPPLVPPPAFAACLILAIAGCLFVPFAWICWVLSNGQLRAIERGERSTTGKDTILLARGMAKVMTFFILTVAVIMVIVGYSP